MLKDLSLRKDNLLCLLQSGHKVGEGIDCFTPLNIGETLS